LSCHWGGRRGEGNPSRAPSNLPRRWVSDLPLPLIPRPRSRVMETPPPQPRAPFFGWGEGSGLAGVGLRAFDRPGRELGSETTGASGGAMTSRSEVPASGFSPFGSRTEGLCWSLAKMLSCTTELDEPLHTQNAQVGAAMRGMGAVDAVGAVWASRSAPDRRGRVEHAVRCAGVEEERVLRASGLATPTVSIQSSRLLA